MKAADQEALVTFTRVIDHQVDTLEDEWGTAIEELEISFVTEEGRVFSFSRVNNAVVLSEIGPA